jgi:malonyl-CoA/methylmalonyl-CoA synthetase
VDDPHQLREDLAAGTLPAAISATAAKHANRPALRIGEASATHGELDERAARAAGWLEGRSVGLGDRVLLCAPTSIELVAAYLAVLRVGATAVFASPASTVPELDQLVSRSGAELALAEGGGVAALEAVAYLKPGLEVVSLRPRALEGPALDVVSLSSESVAVLAYTSGTTGTPKAVPLTHANLLASIRGAARAWRWSPDDVLVHALPLVHQHGLSGIHATLLNGSRAVVLPRFDAADLAAAVGAERATVMFAVPAMYERLVASDHTPEAASAFGSLRLAVSGSAPLPPTLARRAERLIGQVPLERYGSTEAGLDVSNLYAGPRRPGSVGLPLPGIEITVVDDEGTPVASDVDGEIVVRGPQVFGGYLDDPDSTVAAFFPGGWFRTGDIGRIDSTDGYLAITGRLKDVVITGGMNVHPREVELALEEQPDIERAAVVGVPSERWGEEVVAFVVPAAGSRVDGAALVAEAKRRLSPHKVPKRVIVIEAIPVNDVGKVLRQELVRLATP